MHLTSLIKGIVAYEDIHNESFFELELNTFDDYTKYIITQLIYIQYLSLVNTKSKYSLLESYKNALIMAYKNIAYKMNKDIHPVFNYILNYNISNVDSLHDILNIPYSQCMSNNQFNYIGITSNFLVPFINSITGTLSNHIPKNKNYYENASFLYPSLQNVYDEKKDKHEILIILTPINFQKFKLKNTRNRDTNAIRTDNAIFYEYFSRFDLSNLNLDQILLLLSNFAFEFKDYPMVMNYPSLTIPEFCKNIIVNNRKHTTKNIVDSFEFIQFIKTIYKDYRIEIYDNIFFTEILSRTGMYSEELVAYLKKPLNEITVNETAKFNSSVFSSFLPNKFETVIESFVLAKDDEETTSDVDNQNEDDVTESDDPPSEENLEEDTEALDDLDEQDEFNEDDNSSEEADVATTDTPTEEEKKSSLIIFKLAKTESLADYDLRKRLRTAIQNVLNSEIKKYSTEEISLLKKWNSEWFDILSIQTTKQFLNNLTTIRFDNLLK